MEGSPPAPSSRAAEQPAHGDSIALTDQGTDRANAADGDGVRATSFLQRASLRRRLAYLRRRREVSLRDLGGFVFETRRQGQERHELLADKLAAVERIDSERERLERALGERRELLVLREPGITVCPRCSTLHGSEDRFCPGCGTPAARATPAPGEPGIAAP